MHDKLGRVMRNNAFEHAQLAQTQMRKVSPWPLLSIRAV